MRFSSCCTSISPSTRPTSSSSRAPVSVASSRRCFSPRRTPRWAATVSASRPGSSMPASVCSLDLALLARMGHFDDVGATGQRAVALGDVVDVHAIEAFHQHLDRAIGQLEELQHLGQRADAVQVGAARIVGLGRLLRDEQDALVGFHRLLQRPDRLVATDEERDHHVREHHHVAERQYRQGEGLGMVGHGDSRTGTAGARAFGTGGVATIVARGSTPRNASESATWGLRDEDASARDARVRRASGIGVPHCKRGAGS